MQETRKQIAAEILAARIANRDTELHRAYDAARAEFAVAIAAQNAASSRVSASMAKLAQCLRRAREQGYPTTFFTM